MDKKNHYWWIDSSGKLQISTYSEVCLCFSKMAQKKFMRDTIELVKKEINHAAKNQ